VFRVAGEGAYGGGDADHDASDAQHGDVEPAPRSGLHGPEG
jgi:hypothetical protein